MSRLTSINVGLPKEVEWRGQAVRTAIYKHPVAGSVFVSHLNVDGDGQADQIGHGGENRAVMVYQIESYRHWQKVLGRDDFEYGMFGENLTVEGLSDSEVCIGDQYQIGGALFEVTQPRVTCFKIGIRLNHAEIPALMVSQGRPGFYLRVLREGAICAGDAITKVASGPEAMTVAEISSLLYSSRHPIGSLQRALRIPSLSPGWKESFNALLEAELSGSNDGNAGLSSYPNTPPIWQGFRELEVIDSKQESHEVRSFTLAARDGAQLPFAVAGQHLAVKVHRLPNSPPELRMYSLSGSPETGRYRIGIKREQPGGISEFLHQTLKLGAKVEVSAPRGNFVLTQKAIPLVLMSAGIGVTPLLAMLHAAIASQPHREIWWIHGARDGLHHSFSSEVRTLVAQRANVRSVIAYSRPIAELDVLGNHFDLFGHLEPHMLEKFGIPKIADFYLCGPDGFLSDMARGLQSWGVQKNRIQQERFGSVSASVLNVDRKALKSSLFPVSQGPGPTVTFVRSAISVSWDDRFSSLLELAEFYSVPVKWSCRAGVCHQCESGLLDGEFRYGLEPIDRPPEGTMLICCARPTSHIQLDL